MQVKKQQLELDMEQQTGFISGKENVKAIYCHFADLTYAYLRLLIFLPTSLIPACASSSLAFLMMYSGYKLNKQGDSIPYLFNYVFCIYFTNI